MSHSLASPTTHTHNPQQVAECTGVEPSLALLALEKTKDDKNDAINLLLDDRQRRKLEVQLGEQAGAGGGGGGAAGGLGAAASGGGGGGGGGDAARADKRRLAMLNQYQQEMVGQLQALFRDAPLGALIAAVQSHPTDISEAGSLLGEHQVAGRVGWGGGSRAASHVSSPSNHR